MKSKKQIVKETLLKLKAKGLLKEKNIKKYLREVNHQKADAIDEKKRSELFKKCGLIWAFSDEQFAEQKQPLENGDKYVSIGAGGYVPKSKVDMLLDGLAEIRKNREAQTKKMTPKEQYDEISYQLNNHECFYTYDIEPVVDMFKGRYTEKQINDVFMKEGKKHKNDF